MFRNSFQLIKVIVVFHIILDIIIRNNCQRSNQSLPMQSGFYLWDKLLNILKLIGANMANNQNLTQMWIEMRSWTCLGPRQFQECSLCHMYNCFEPFAFNGQQHKFTIGCSKTIKKAWFLNFWFWTTSITINIACRRDDDILYDTPPNSLSNQIWVPKWNNKKKKKNRNMLLSLQHF